MVGVNDVYAVKIEDTNIFANGVCHIDGLVVFVNGALTGEECEIQITEVHSKYAYANVINLISASSERINPSCPSFSRCGGCSLLHCSLFAENEIKEKYISSTFKKSGIDIKIEKIATPVAGKYRNKVVFFIENGKYGYMENGTNQLVEHEECILNEDIFDQIASFTVDSLKGTAIRALYIRKSKNENEVMVCPIFYTETNIFKYVADLVESFPNVKTVLYSVYNDKNFALEKVKFKTLYGVGYIYDELCGLRFRISPKSFYQVNPLCAERLYEKAIELAGLSSDSTCADLFCGTGTIGLVCAKETGAKVYGVEIVEDAVRDAKFNAKLNGINNITFEATDAKNFNKAVDVCIIDPPRKGCSQLMLDTLLHLKPNRIVYVSCNAETLARDLKLLINEYDIASPLYPFNMFPRTSHVESVVCLEKRKD